MWTFSRPLIGLAVGTYVVGSIDLWVLSAFAGARAVGTYAAAYRSYAVLMTVAAAASPVLMTLFVSLRLAGRSTDIRRYVERVVPALVLLAGAVAAIAVAPAYLLMPVVFGHAFAGGSLPLAILLIAVVAYLQLSLLATVLGSHDRTFETARVFLAAALVNVVGDLIAVGLLGAGSWAPATATVAFALLVAAGYLRVAGECTGARVRFPFAAYVPPALAVSALVLVPEASRVVASLAVGALASIIALAVHARTLGVDAELLAKLPSTELWSRALAGVRGRP
jgi:O-antigen/teichoic acid export membrane protein